MGLNQKNIEVLFMATKKGSEQSEQSSKGGDTSTETRPTPLERFKSQARHPTIAKLREPGKTQITFPKRSGEIPFSIGKVLGKLNLFLRGNGTVSINHTATSISELVDKGHLLSLANSGDKSVTKVKLWLRNKRSYAVVERQDLKNFLTAAGIVAGK
ncbi:TPA: hypothetical protein DEP94_02990 [Candidatus Nomurabacteria bacterium]|nr:hypothetical protein [Candidatus Nomurabacteria bacterium]